MSIVGAAPLFHKLDQRRKELGMSCAALAKRSGVSLTSVIRILSGQHCQSNFSHVWAIAEALGMSLETRPQIRVTQLRERQARQKAASLVKMLQATSSLEAQGLGRTDLDEMTRQTTHDLLAGSSRKLWED